mgnify:CR=1 FL=1
MIKLIIFDLDGTLVDLKDVQGEFKLDQEVLYSESTGRILLTIDPKNKTKFESLMRGIKFANIGEVSQFDAIKIKGLKGKEIITAKVGDALESYSKRFKEW